MTAEEDLAPVVDGEEGEILEDAVGEAAAEGEEDTSGEPDPEEN